MKLSDEELEQLRDKAQEIALSMSDFLRKRSGFRPLHRGVGRPAFQVTCPVPGCKAVVGASAYAKHVRNNHPNG
jgi:hypothetical protein